MKHINVIVHAVGDPPCFTECQPCREGEAVGFAILEKGTEEGAVSTGLFTKMPNGTYIWTQITASMFLAMAGAVKGACQRFNDTKNL